MNSISSIIQTVEIQRRPMLQILSLICDTNALCRTLDETLLVISLEFLEAFDKVAIDFLFAALLKFRCGANFSQWYPL